MYGNALPSTEYVAVDHKGYIFAQESSNYTFSVSVCDDITLVCIGQAAFPTYPARFTAAIQQLYIVSGGTVKTYVATYK
ncbi:hypothetical protein MMC15_006785 [Xylographa vitiligo]|nr:hypothetical protein [Xylographa vitiligo]